MQYDVFISYAHNDQIFVEFLMKKLESKGIKVWIATHHIEVGSNFHESVIDAISNCKKVIVILTQDSIKSPFVLRELAYAQERAKAIIPLLRSVTLSDLPSDFMSITEKTAVQHVSNNDDIKQFVDYMINLFQYDNSLEILFEKLSAYRRNRDDEKEVDTLCSIIEIFLNKLQSVTTEKEEHTTLMNLLNSLDALKQTSIWSCKNQAEKRMSVLNSVMTHVEKTYDSFSKYSSDIFIASAIIRMLYLHREISFDSIDVMHNGDHSDGIPLPGFSKEKYESKQFPYVQTYKKILADTQLSYETPLQYTYEEVHFILTTEQYIYFGSNIDKKR